MAVRAPAPIAGVARAVDGVRRRRPLPDGGGRRADGADRDGADARRRPARAAAVGVRRDGRGDGTAAALGPAVGGCITRSFGWRALFLVNLPLVVASWLLQPPAFGGRDARAARHRQLIDLSFLRTPVYAAGAGVIALQNLAFYALLFQMPFLFPRRPVTGPRDESQLGLVMMAMTVTMAVWSPIGGRIAEKDRCVEGGVVAGSLHRRGRRSRC